MAPIHYQPMKRTFFQMTEARWMMIISSGLAMLIWSWLAPATIPGPYGVYLGPLGLLGRFLGTNFPGVVASLVYIAGFLHVAESLYAAKICWDNKLTPLTTVKWFFQTLAFGVASLGVLRNRAKNSKRG